jgi:hypothetical protein
MGGGYCGVRALYPAFRRVFSKRKRNLSDRVQSGRYFKPTPVGRLRCTNSRSVQETRFERDAAKDGDIGGRSFGKRRLETRRFRKRYWTFSARRPGTQTRRQELAGTPASWNPATYGPPGIPRTPHVCAGCPTDRAGRARRAPLLNLRAPAPCAPRSPTFVNPETRRRCPAIGAPFNNIASRGGLVIRALRAIYVESGLPDVSKRFQS